MIRRKHLFKLFVAVAVAASVSVVGARSAKATEPPYNSHAYVYGGASLQEAQAIQSAGIEGVRFASAEHKLKAVRAQTRTLITDTLGGNGKAKAQKATSGSTRFVAS